MTQTLVFGTPPEDPDSFREWCVQAFEEIRNLAEQYDAFDVFDDFTVSNYTETTSLNAGTATATDVANFVATLVHAMQKRGLRGETGL